MRQNSRALAGLAALPGAELVLPGIEDAMRGRVTPAACLVAIARSRLAKSGLLPADFPPPATAPDETLYRLLGDTRANPYGAYNALRRRLHSFLRALADERRQPSRRLAEG